MKSKLLQKPSTNWVNQQTGNDEQTENTWKRMEKIHLYSLFHVFKSQWYSISTCSLLAKHQIIFDKALCHTLQYNPLKNKCTFNLSIFPGAPGFLTPKRKATSKKCVSLWEECSSFQCRKLWTKSTTGTLSLLFNVTGFLLWFVIIQWCLRWDIDTKKIGNRETLQKPRSGTSIPFISVMFLNVTWYFFFQTCSYTQNPWSSGRLQILLILSRFEVVLIQPYLFSLFTWWVQKKKKNSDATYAEDYFSSTN